MQPAHELLRSIVEEKRPMVLLLGQDAWVESKHGDMLLTSALDKLGKAGEPRSGWLSMLADEPLPPDHYEWLAERFERRVQPSSVEILCELPWGAVFTSSVDPTLTELFSRRGRTVEPILTESQHPRAARSTVRPPLYYLFSRAGERDPNAQPPVDRVDLNARRTRDAIPLLNRMLDTATSLGTIIVDGLWKGNGWLRFEDVLGALSGAASGQILWFGGRPNLDGDERATFARMERKGQILIHPMRLGTTIAELRALDWLPEISVVGSEEANIVSFGDGNFIEVTPEERLQVETVASVVDDSWTGFLPPLGPDSRYDAFRRFHGDLGGARLLVEGVRREFAIERDFERQLIHVVYEALEDHAKLRSPIIVDGQSGTGKSVALARVVVRIREEQRAPVLYSVGRVPQLDEVSGFCQAVEKAQANATLIVCDANRDVDSYNELLSGLRSRGRRVVVLGSQYRAISDNGQLRYRRVEAPSILSRPERQKLEDLLTQYVGDTRLDQMDTQHFLAFLYRYLPASRPRIGSGLGAEARAAVQLLRERGSQSRDVVPITQLHQQLIEKGFVSAFEPVFADFQETDEGAPGRVIDFVMVCGRLGCPVPVDLVLRAASHHRHRIDSALISSLFRELDLLRWESSEPEGNEWVLLPRLRLEADLICRRRLGNPRAESSLIVELISCVRQGIDNKHEVDFLLHLLQQVGTDGLGQSRYKHAYIDFARALTDLREHSNIADPRLILQESVFRRSAIREGQVDDDLSLDLLEEARNSIQTALDEIDRNPLLATRRARQNLLGERAAVYGFLARNREKQKKSPTEIWLAYQAAKVAIREAISSSDNYYPYDVSLWTPADLFKSEMLTESQKEELVADIYSRLDQIEHDTLSPIQQAKFWERQAKVGATLRNHKLSDEAYLNLEESGSTAGYFIRAREYAPYLNADKVEVDDMADVEKARYVTDYLNTHFDKIEHDERCLWLLLENQWIAEMQRRPLRGERQPLPTGDARRRILMTVQALNRAAGVSARFGTRYLEAVLTWMEGEYFEAREMFRLLYTETDDVYYGRTFRRHLISNEDGSVSVFSGRIEGQRGGQGRWGIRVDELNQIVALLDRDFPLDNISYGRTLSKFAVAFNFIGPIADPHPIRR